MNPTMGSHLTLWSHVPFAGLVESVNYYPNQKGLVNLVNQTSWPSNTNISFYSVGSSSSAWINSVTAQDIDADGLPDVVIAEYTSAESFLVVLRNNYCLLSQPCHNTGICHTADYNPVRGPKPAPQPPSPAQQLDRPQRGQVPLSTFLQLHHPPTRWRWGSQAVLIPAYHFEAAFCVML